MQNFFIFASFLRFKKVEVSRKMNEFFLKIIKSADAENLAADFL